MPDPEGTRASELLCLCCVWGADMVHRAADVRALIACPNCRRRHVDDFNMGALIFALSTYAGALCGVASPTWRAQWLKLVPCLCVCVRVPDGVIAAGDTDADTASHGGSDDDDDAGGGDAGGGGGQATDASLQVYDMGHSRVHFAQRTHGSMRMLVVRPRFLSAHPARTSLLTRTPTVPCHGVWCGVKRRPCSWSQTCRSTLEQPPRQIWAPDSARSTPHGWMLAQRGACQRYATWY